jgi:prepilin-type N-terminal cleavage/methylation domain-containing protein
MGELMRKKFINEKGFTLLEAMIALSILSVGLISLAGLFAYSINGTADGGRMTEASSLAQQKLDQFKATPFPNITGGSETNIGATGSPPGPYTRSWYTSRDADPKLAADLKIITVRVTWQTRGFNNNLKHTATLTFKRVNDS